MSDTRTNKNATVAYVGLGSNLGDRRGHLVAAVRGLARHAAIEIKETASLYETSPVGGPSGQTAYLNSVARLTTTCSPREFLKVALSIETSLGREHGVRWDARVIDIDVLLFGDDVIDEADLRIPHPRLHLRRFVLEPLCDLAGEIIHPSLGKSIQRLAEDVRRSGNDETVRRVESADWSVENGHIQPLRTGVGVDAGDSVR